MCYNSSQTKTLKEIQHRFGVKSSEAVKIYNDNFTAFRFNGFDHPEMLIIKQADNELDMAQWGILPQAIRDYEEAAYLNRYKGGTLNTKSELVFKLKVASENIFTRRCILPLTGFFEYHSFSNHSYPFYFERKDNDFTSVACIYCETFDGTKGFSMLTKSASELFKTVHNIKNKDNQYRQIVLLDKGLEKEWLREGLKEAEIKEILSASIPDSELRTWPVSKQAFSSYQSNNSEQIIAPHEYPEFAFNEDIQGILSNT